MLLKRHRCGTDVVSRRAAALIPAAAARRAGLVVRLRLAAQPTLRWYERIGLLGAKIDYYARCLAGTSETNAL